MAALIWQKHHASIVIKIHLPQTWHRMLVNQIYYQFHNNKIKGKNDGFSLTIASAKQRNKKLSTMESALDTKQRWSQTQ